MLHPIISISETMSMRDVVDSLINVCVVTANGHVSGL